MSVAIVGCGSIGIGWAIVFARAGETVHAWDPDASVRAGFSDAVRSRLTSLEEFDLLTEAIDSILARINVEETMEEAVKDAAYIQESGPERVEIKREILTAIDAAAPADAVIASSSSAITTSQMSEGVPGKSRILIVHPGNPPYLLPVAELVPSPATSPAIVDAADALLSRAGMTPVRVNREVEGFIFNRLQGAVLREAYRLVEQGVASARDIDRVITDGLGRRWGIIGPFATAHLNVRGGVTAHAARMGESYRRMSASEHPGWSEALVAAVAAEMEEALPVAAWDDWVSQRDRSLMVMEKARRSSEFGVGR